VSAPAIPDRGAALTAALQIAREAAAIVLRVYATPFAVDYKGADDPVTLADREANALIVSRLLTTFPGIPVVAEESDPSAYEGFDAAPAVWFVDPLDGTREFVARNGEFGVMIGLAEKGRATAGVLVAPALRRIFAGAVGIGAFELDGDLRRPLHVSGVGSIGQARVTVSRSRRTPALDLVLDRLAPLSVTPFGSGVKGALVAAGEADVYLQVGRAGLRWDACAPEAIVVAAGGAMTDAEGAPIDYASRVLENTRGLVATNGVLHEAVLRALAVEG
jgi:3'(2'), 5'-bisphosphate nucleotidase